MLSPKIVPVCVPEFLFQELTGYARSRMRAAGFAGWGKSIIDLLCNYIRPLKPFFFSWFLSHLLTDLFRSTRRCDSMQQAASKNQKKKSPIFFGKANYARGLMKLAMLERLGPCKSEGWIELFVGTFLVVGSACIVDDADQDSASNAIATDPIIDTLALRSSRIKTHVRIRHVKWIRGIF